MKDRHTSGIFLYESPPIGNVKGKYVQVGKAFRVRGSGGQTRKYGVCQCSCGTVEAVELPSIKDSQGCRHCATKDTPKSHGKVKTPEYTSWTAMLKRCRDPHNIGYKNYGGRGIKVCEQWQGKTGFQTFLDHIGPKPFTGAQIDRVDVNGDYEPGNVRWVSPKDNCRNRRNNRTIRVFSETKTQVEWCELFGISNTTFNHRLDLGIPAEDALTIPVGSLR